MKGSFKFIDFVLFCLCHGCNLEEVFIDFFFFYIIACLPPKFPQTLNYLLIIIPVLNGYATIQIYVGSLYSHYTGINDYQTVQNW